MPYFIEQENAECKSGWAVVDQGGDVFGCHTTKQAAIDQAVAISLSTDEPFEGERFMGDNGIMDVRAVLSDLAVGDVVRWIADDDVMWGVVVSVEADPVQVTVYDEEDGTYIVTEVVASVEASKLEVVDGFPVPEPETPDNAPDGEMMPEGRDRRERESRTNHARIEVREGVDGMTFEGYAAVFDSPSEPLPFVEKIERGAFRDTLRARNDIKLLWNHDSSQVLGSTRARTLTLVEDDRGLRVQGILPNTTAGRDAAELLKRGDVDAMSFGFTTIKDAWSNDGTQRTLKAVRLHEVSIVAFPAYSGTAGTTSVRKLDVIASRAQVNVDALTSALQKVEAGEDITADDRTLLTKVIDELAPGDVEQVAEFDMLTLKKKKLQLLKGF